MGTIIGIDLGTTNSACAFLDRGEPKVIINEEGGRVTPSVVGFAEDGERFIGDIAKRQLLINPAATVHTIKRFMGRRYADSADERGRVEYDVVEGRNGDVAVRVRDRDWSPQELSAMILQKLKKSAEDFLGETVTEAVITVPAYFTDRQRQATRDAGTIAGLDVLRIINEPTAAALAYLHDKRDSSTIAVFDFGGGTFDISLLKVEKDLAHVHASRGNHSLGGTDIDEVIVQWLRKQFEAQHSIDVSENRVVMQRLRDAAERAKVELSQANSTDIHLPFLIADAAGPKHLQTTLVRSTFEELIGPIVQRTMDECKRALEEADLSVKDIDEVIMVGGSSRIPLVQKRVKKLFGRPLNKGFNPDEVVAMGAAIQAGILEGDLKSVTLLDVTNFSLGIEVAGGRFATLIPKNSTIPAQRAQLVSTVVDNQRTVKVHVLQGESPRAKDNTSLGEFELQNIQPAPRGEPRIRVTFTIDANGIVLVQAEDTRTGRSEQITIDAPTGLSREEVSEMRTAAEADAAEQVATKEVKRLRLEVEQALVSLEELLRDRRASLHKNQLGEAESALKRGRMALLKSSDRANLEELAAYLGRFHAQLAGDDTAD